VTLALIARAVALSRTEACHAVAKARDEFEKSFPSYVVHLKRDAADG
jgi:hypothetical protein